MLPPAGPDGTVPFDVHMDAWTNKCGVLAGLQADTTHAHNTHNTTTTPYAHQRGDV